MKKKLTVAITIATLALAGACGGGGDRPSKDDLAKTLSDKALKALAENDSDFKPSAADTKAQTDTVSALGKCLAP